MRSKFTTKATRLGNKGYGCRVFYGGTLVVEAKVPTRDLIGPAFRDLMRTLDTLGGDKFTSASRKRKFKAGNRAVSVRHFWARAK